LFFQQISLTIGLVILLRCIIMFIYLFTTCFRLRTCNSDVARESSSCCTIALLKRIGDVRRSTRTVLFWHARIRKGLNCFQTNNTAQQRLLQKCDIAVRFSASSKGGTCSFVSPIGTVPLRIGVHQLSCAVIVVCISASNCVRFYTI
jgi:hypothetical protein